MRDPEANLIQLFEPAASDRVWSAEPASVRVLDDGEQPAPEAQHNGWRRWAPWLSLLLAGVLALVFIELRREDPTVGPPTSSPEPTIPVTTADQGAVNVTEVGEPMLGVTGDWELIAYGRVTVSRIELDRGQVTTTELPDVRSSGPVSLLAGPDWTIVSPWEDDVPAYLVPDGKPARELRLQDYGGGGRLFPGPQPDRFWMEDLDQGNAREITLHLSLVTGERIGVPITLPNSDAITPDGAGYVLAPMTGGTYVFRPKVDGVRRVTIGRVDAVSADFLLATECDQRALCFRTLISRATGQRRTVGRSVGPTARSRHAIAPDGSISVEVRDNGLFVTDLVTGGGQLYDVLVRPGFPDSGVVFSPDSEWLFGIGHDGEVVAIDTDTFQAHDLGASLGRISQLTIRTSD